MVNHLRFTWWIPACGVPGRREWRIVGFHPLVPKISTCCILFLHLWNQEVDPEISHLDSRKDDLDQTSTSIHPFIHSSIHPFIHSSPSHPFIHTAIQPIKEGSIDPPFHPSIHPLPCHLLRSRGLWTDFPRSQLSGAVLAGGGGGGNSLTRKPENTEHTVDGSEIRLYNQLRLVVYLIIYKVFYIPGGAGFLPSTVVPLYRPQARTTHDSWWACWDVEKLGGVTVQRGNSKKISGQKVWPKWSSICCTRADDPPTPMGRRFQVSNIKKITLPETNIAPENRPPQ